MLTVFSGVVQDSNGGVVISLRRKMVALAVLLLQVKIIVHISENFRHYFLKKRKYLYPENVLNIRLFQIFLSKIPVGTLITMEFQSKSIGILLTDSLVNGFLRSGTGFQWRSCNFTTKQRRLHLAVLFLHVKIMCHI